MTQPEHTVLEAIRNRRSIGKVTEKIPPQDVIERILDAGVWAPNHHLTQPWRFFVISGAGRTRLGEAMAAFQTAEMEDGEAKQKAWDTAVSRPLRAPVLIAITVEPDAAEHVEELEEIVAAGAAGQNMLLAAHALGLAAIWRTGKPAFSEQVREFFGLSERGKVLGFIYLGYPAMEPPQRERRPASECTTWIQ